MRAASRYAVVALLVAAVISLVAFFWTNVPSRSSDQPPPVPQASTRGEDSPETPEPVAAAPALDGSGVVTGVVRWAESEEPAAGVTVIAESLSGHPALRAESAKNGDFLIDGLVAGEEYTLRAGDRDGPPFGINSLTMRVEADGIVEGQDLYVESGYSVSGRVVRLVPAPTKLDNTLNAQDRLMKAVADSMSAEPEKQPLAGVRLTLMRTNQSGEPRTRFESVSDASGNYRFNDIPSGQYSLDPQRPDGAVALDVMQRHRLQSLMVTNPGLRDLEVAFAFNSIVVQGRVVDRSSQPVAGATILAAANDPHAPPINVETVTDDQGRYLLEGLPGANLMQVVQESMSDFPGDACTLVVHATGYASARMNLTTASEAQTASFRGLSAAFIDPDAHPSVESGEPGGVIPTGEGHMIQVPDIVLNGEATVAGRVRDTSGKLIPEAEVEARLIVKDQPADAKLAAHSPPPVTTGADGSFSLGGVAEGSYRFLVTNPALEINEENIGAPLSVSAGQQITNAEIVVAAPAQRGTIRGQVIVAENNGPPQRGFTVLVEDVVSAAGNTPRRTGDVRYIQEEPGAFEITNVSPGLARLQVWVPQHPRHRQGVRVSAGQISTVTVRVATGGNVTGIVTRSGAPMPDAQVMLFVDDLGRYVESRGADNKGEFSIEDVPPGDYLVSATKWNRYTRYASSRVTVRSGETSRVNIALDGNATLSGTLVAPPEYGHRAVFVQLPGTEPMSPDNEAQIASRAIAGDTMHRNGDFKFEGLPDGRFMLVAIAYNLHETQGKVLGDTLVITQSVTLRAGETVNANLDIR